MNKTIIIIILALGLLTTGLYIAKPSIFTGNPTMENSVTFTSDELLNLYNKDKEQKSKSIKNHGLNKFVVRNKELPKEFEDFECYTNSDSSYFLFYGVANNGKIQNSDVIGIAYKNEDLNEKYKAEFINLKFDFEERTTKGIDQEIAVMIENEKITGVLFQNDNNLNYVIITKSDSRTKPNVQNVKSDSKTSEIKDKSCFDKYELDLIKSYRQYDISNKDTKIHRYKAEGVVFWFKEYDNKITGELVVNGIASQVYGLYTDEGNYEGAVWFNGQNKGVIYWDGRDDCTTLINKVNCKQIETFMCLSFDEKKSQSFGK